MGKRTAVRGSRDRAELLIKRWERLGIPLEADNGGSELGGLSSQEGNPGLGSACLILCSWPHGGSSANRTSIHLRKRKTAIPILSCSQIHVTALSDDVILRKPALGQQKENKSCSMKRGGKTEIGGDGCDVKECFWAPRRSSRSAVAGQLRVFNKQPVET
ncbi:unnamed protein product [Pleuronectes platessa]|uniref:Uncharacterized protein n=1 Tax=Pleuronectes platessa TaxID=8262 RepID=A0A9N7YEE0_PLEPL|nr:unnamed protein product [Pleuronectes platessa]